MEEILFHSPRDIYYALEKIFFYFIHNLFLLSAFAMLIYLFALVSFMLEVPSNICSLSAIHPYLSVR